jgi:uncharacterized protein involved in exopolysaccharide biosynthesis
MVEHGPHFGTESVASEEGEGEGIDLERIKELGGFVARAPRRHPLLAAAVFVIVASLGLTLAATMPSTYRASVKLLAQRNIAIRALTSQNEKLSQMEWESPTKGIQDMILRRENLVSLAKDANLVERSSQTRSASLRLKDRITTYFFGPISDEDKLKGMVYTLESRLSAETADDSSVLISAEWSNPNIAYDLVKLVQKNLEEARYDSDVAVINDSVAVLEEHAKQESAHVDAEIQAYQKTVAERLPPSMLRAPGVPARSAIVNGAPRTVSGLVAQEAPDLDAAMALEAKRQEIRNLETAHQRAVDTVRQQFVQAQLTLTPLHPTVIALQKELDAVSEAPAELTAARSDERALMAQIAARPTAAPTAAPANRPASSDTKVADKTADGGAAADPVPLPRADPNFDGQLRLAESKLAASIHSYEDAINRIDSARAELDIARAAYKHRFTEVTPAELPVRPKKPVTTTVAIGSLLGAVILALLFASLADYAKGTFIEPWQVRRALKVDILCELDRPS